MGNNNFAIEGVYAAALTPLTADRAPARLDIALVAPAVHGDSNFYVVHPINLLSGSAHGPRSAPALSG